MPSDSESDTTSNAGYSLWQIVRYMLRLGTLGFGGQVALAGYMRRNLVDDRHWITESDYKEGLALVQLAPGPMAAQLARPTQNYRTLNAVLFGPHADGTDLFDVVVVQLDHGLAI